MIAGLLQDYCRSIVINAKHFVTHTTKLMMDEWNVWFRNIVIHDDHGDKYNTLWI